MGAIQLHQLFQIIAVYGQLYSVFIKTGMPKEDGGWGEFKVGSAGETTTALARRVVEPVRPPDRQMPLIREKDGQIIRHFPKQLGEPDELRHGVGVKGLVGLYSHALIGFDQVNHSALATYPIQIADEFQLVFVLFFFIHLSMIKLKNNPVNHANLVYLSQCHRHRTHHSFLDGMKNPPKGILFATEAQALT